MKNISLRELATVESNKLLQNSQAKQILSRRVLNDRFSIYNPNTRRYWKVVYSWPKLQGLKKFLETLGYKLDEKVVPIDYFQIFYLDYLDEKVYRINVKKGVLLWESNGFFLEKTLQSLPDDHQFKIINHVTQKSSNFFDLRDFYEYFPFKFSIWKSTLPQDLTARANL